MEQTAVCFGRNRHRPYVDITMFRESYGQLLGECNLMTPMAVRIPHYGTYRQQELEHDEHIDRNDRCVRQLHHLRAGIDLEQGKDDDGDTDQYPEKERNSKGYIEALLPCFGPHRLQPGHIPSIGSYVAYQRFTPLRITSLMDDCSPSHRHQCEAEQRTKETHYEHHGDIHRIGNEPHAVIRVIIAYRFDHDNGDYTHDDQKYQHDMETDEIILG